MEVERQLKMLFFWNKEELYCGSSVERYQALCSLLARNGIRYCAKAVSGQYNSGSAMARGRQEVFGLQTSHNTVYYIYVHKKDAGEAGFLMNAM